MEKIYRGMANGAETINRNFDNGYGQKVGDIHISIDSSNPSARFGGTGVRIAKGQAIVGVNESDSDFSTPEKTGGEKTHVLTKLEMPSHTHNITFEQQVRGGGTGYTLLDAGTKTNITSGSAGGDQAHNNLQPFFTLYIWKRTA